MIRQTATQTASFLLILFVALIIGSSPSALAQEACTPGETNLRCVDNHYVGCENGERVDVNCGVLLDHVCSEEFGRAFCFARSGGACIVSNDSGATFESNCLERDEQCIVNQENGIFRCVEGVPECEASGPLVCFDDIVMTCRGYADFDHVFGLGADCPSYGGRCSSGQCLNPPGEICGGSFFFCERGLTCVNNVCALGSIGTSCEVDSDCDQEQECRDGICSINVGVGDFCGADGLDCFESECVDDYCASVPDEEPEEEETFPEEEEGCSSLRAEGSAVFLLGMIFAFLVKARRRIG